MFRLRNCNWGTANYTLILQKHRRKQLTGWEGRRDLTSGLFFEGAFQQINLAGTSGKPKFPNTSSSYRRTLLKLCKWECTRGKCPLSSLRRPNVLKTIKCENLYTPVYDPYLHPHTFVSTYTKVSTWHLKRFKSKNWWQLFSNLKSVHYDDGDDCYYDYDYDDDYDDDDDDDDDIGR